MAGNPSDFPQRPRVHIGVIAGGDINDPAEDHSCNQRVYLPMEHSPDGVKINHLAFSPMQHSPTMQSQQTFHGTLDPGSLVYVLKTTGQNHVSIIGQANDLYNSKASPGNIDLMQSNPIVQELMNRSVQVLTRPDIQEGKERGAKIRKIKEKGKEHSHSLLKGLPTHGALFNISGYKLPQINEIPTALQEFQKILTEDQLGQIMEMASQAMSIGSMFGGLNNTGAGQGGGGGAGKGLGSSNATGDYMQYSNTQSILDGTAVPDLQASVSFMNEGVNPGSRLEGILNIIAKKSNGQELIDAIKSMAVLTQSNLSGPGNTGSFATGDPVHLETFLDHAESMLAEVNTIADIMDVLTELQSNTDLYGQDVLNNLYFTSKSNTAMGNVVHTVSLTGNVQMQHTDSSTQKSMQSISDMMSSASQSPGGGGGGGSMFADQGKNMFDMLKRISPEGQKNALDLIQSVNQGDIGKKVTGIMEKVLTKGGNPLDFKLWQ